MGTKLGNWIGAAFVEGMEAKLGEVIGAYLGEYMGP